MTHRNTLTHTGTLGHIGTLQHIGTLGHIGTLWHIGTSGHIRTLGHIGTFGHIGTLGHIGPLGHIGKLGYIGTFGHIGSLEHIGTHFYTLLHITFSLMKGIQITVVYGRNNTARIYIFIWRQELQCLFWRKDKGDLTLEGSSRWERKFVAPVHVHEILWHIGTFGHIEILRHIGTHFYTWITWHNENWNSWTYLNTSKLK